MKDLLIVSAYGPNAVEDWWNIQQKFIGKHTKNFDFGVFLHNIEDESLFKSVKIIGRAQGELLYTLPEMFHQIYHYFRDHQYKNYLLLDSDCFPIKNDWQEKLEALMEDHWYAAPVRTDNLDVVPHPCALFIKGEHIKKHLFYFRRPSTDTVPNLLGEETQDIGTGFKTKIDDKQVFYPLMRSNFVNVHPVLGAIYGDTFYHHGAGSRMPWFRSTPYWQKLLPIHYRLGLNCYYALTKDPEKFISKLRGDAESIKNFFYDR